jgi:multidrug efflux system membrane fusion protein
MSDGNKFPMDPGAQPPRHEEEEGAPPVSAQMRRDMEIIALQEHSRFKAPQVQHAPVVPPAPPGRALKIVGGLFGLLLVAGGLTLLAQVSHARSLAKSTERDAVPTVAVVSPRQESPDEELVLPCSLEAYEESPIYARTNGYLLRWYRDIGSHVTKGELLAEIDTPEVDQEYNQALAARQQIVAQMDLAKISADRWQKLVKSKSVSEQENDVQSSGYRQAQASLADADANVRRLGELEGFKKVYAPFTGVLTRRNVDPGALINAGAGATGRELFDMARVDTLRIFSSVPQAYSPFTKNGTKATITLQEYPGQTFTGVVARTAEAITNATRTLYTEVDIPNKDGRLLPGSFGEVHFSVGSGANKVTIPVNALLFRAAGPQAAVVGPDGKVELRHIDIGRDYGTTLEILSGVSPTDKIIVNPSDSIESGQLVHVAQSQDTQQ